jgi:hypothetical protein
MNSTAGKSAVHSTPIEYSVHSTVQPAFRTLFRLYTAHNSACTYIVHISEPSSQFDLYTNCEQDTAQPAKYTLLHQPIHSTQFSLYTCMTQLSTETRHSTARSKYTIQPENRGLRPVCTQDTVQSVYSKNCSNIPVTV